jgi:hypothetical protein
VWLGAGGGLYVEAVTDPDAAREFARQLAWAARSPAGPCVDEHPGPATHPAEGDGTWSGGSRDPLSLFASLSSSAQPPLNYLPHQAAGSSGGGGATEDPPVRYLPDGSPQYGPIQAGAQGPPSPQEAPLLAKAATGLVAAITTCAAEISDTDPGARAEAFLLINIIDTILTQAAVAYPRVAVSLSGASPAVGPGSPGVPVLTTIKTTIVTGHSPLSPQGAAAAAAAAGSGAAAGSDAMMPPPPRHRAMMNQSSSSSSSSISSPTDHPAGGFDQQGSGSGSGSGSSGDSVRPDSSSSAAAHGGGKDPSARLVGPAGGSAAGQAVTTTTTMGGTARRGDLGLHRAVSGGADLTMAQQQQPNPNPNPNQQHHHQQHYQQHQPPPPPPPPPIAQVACTGLLWIPFAQLSAPPPSTDDHPLRAISVLLRLMAFPQVLARVRSAQSIGAPDALFRTLNRVTDIMASPDWSTAVRHAAVRLFAGIALRHQAGVHLLLGLHGSTAAVSDDPTLIRNLVMLLYNEVGAMEHVLAANPRAEVSASAALVTDATLLLRTLANHVLLPELLSGERRFFVSFANRVARCGDGPLPHLPLHHLRSTVALLQRVIGTTGDGAL